MNEYWTISEPPLPEDDEDGREYMFRFFRNGQVRIDDWELLVICPCCVERTGGVYYTFPIQFAEIFKEHPAIANGESISFDEFEELAPIFQEGFERSGIDRKKMTLDPHQHRFWLGRDFADRIIEIPCHPSVSFHWNFSDAVVSEVVKEVFEREKISGVIFREARINWVGKFDLAQSEPAWDHLMWWMQEGCVNGASKDYPEEKEPSRFGPLYGMIVTNWAPRADIDKKKYPFCKVCGCELMSVSEWRNFLTQNQFISYDMFHVWGVPHVVISDRVRQVIEDNGFTNCHLTKLEVRG